MFALQNVLASGSQMPRWSPCSCLGLNLGPSPMHARNVYLVLNLVTGCVSPQYHCRFDDFFEMTRHGAPDVSGTICWKQLANLDCAKTALAKVSVPNQHSVMYWRCRLLRSLILWAILSTILIPLTPLQMTTVSQRLRRCQRTVTLLSKIDLLTGLMRWWQLSLLSQLVQANVDKFAPCHKEW